MTSLTTIASALAALDVELPAASREVVELEAAFADALRVDAAELDLRAAIEEATAADAEEIVANAKRALADADAAPKVRSMIDFPLRARARAALAADGDAIVLALRPAWDAAASIVDASRAMFGENPDAAAIGRAGPAAGAAWGERMAAIDTLTTIRNVRVQLASAGYGPPRQAAEWYVADVDELDAARRAFEAPGNGLHNLADAGLKLRLNTLAEVAALGRNRALRVDPAEEAERERLGEELRRRWRHYLEPAGQ